MVEYETVSASSAVIRLIRVQCADAPSTDETLRLNCGPARLGDGAGLPPAKLDPGNL